jgi:diaminopimelate epimerase
VSIGNPHAVVLVDDADSVDLVVAGAAVPDINLEVIAAEPEAGAITMRVHERGVGITEACGTGACAAAWAARDWGLVGTQVVVHMLGGDGEVTLDGDSVTLAGPAVHIADIEVPETEVTA